MSKRAEETRIAPAWLAATGVAIALLLVSILLPDQPRPVPISAEIHRSGDVSFMLKGAPASATSPACGCTHSHVPGGWRGIVLPAQELEIARQTDEPESATQYDISSSGTQSIGMLPEQVGINLRMGFVAVRDRDQGRDPFKLPHGDVLLDNSEQVRADWLSIITSGPLQLASNAREPVAALSPPENRWTTLSYSEDDESPSSETLSVRTAFNPSADKDGYSGQNAYPILDVLGPRIRMWAPVRGVRFPMTTAEYEGLLPGEAGEKYSLAARAWPRDSPPAAPYGWSPEVVIETRAPLFAARLAIRPARLNDKPRVLEHPAHSGGTVTISDPHVARNAKRLVPQFKAADRNPKFWISNMPFIPTRLSDVRRTEGEEPDEASYDGRNEQFEYPPTPPLSGINVFGTIADLRFSEATADMSIGTESRSLAARTPIELRNIKGTGVVGHHMIVPVRVNGQDAKIHVIGEADTRINGQPIAQDRPWLASVLTDEKVSWFLGLVSAFAFVNGLRVRPWRKRTA
jgi:hypothetical protein